MSREAINIGTILVNTVSDTRRGAIVNYLVAEKSIPVFKFHTDQDIENMWAHFGKYADCRTVEIAFQEQ